MTQIAQIDGKIYVALATHMDTFTGADVFYSPDTPQNTPRALPYIVVDDLRLDADTRFIHGDAPDEYRGILNLSVMVPMQWTGAQSIGLAALVADHWPKASWHEYGGARVQVMRRPKVIGTGYQDSGMIRYPVQVLWRAVG